VRADGLDPLFREGALQKVEIPLAALDYEYEPTCDDFPSPG
jgi:hypothetical protein